MKMIFASVAVVGMSVVACSQGPNAAVQESGAGSTSEASIIIPQCAKQIPNATAPTSGTKTYNAWTSTYVAPGCKSYIVQLADDGSLTAQASLEHTYDAASCAALRVNMQVVDYESWFNDCSDQPPPCKPSGATTGHVVAEADAHGVWTGGQCQLQGATLNASWAAQSDTTTVRLLVSAYETPTGGYQPVWLSVTSH
jgi:hypothetical protein